MFRILPFPKSAAENRAVVRNFFFLSTGKAATCVKLSAPLHLVCMKAPADAPCRAVSVTVCYKDDDYTAAQFPRYFQSTHNNSVPPAHVIQTWIEIIDEVSQVQGKKEWHIRRKIPTLSVLVENVLRVKLIATDRRSRCV